MGMPTSHGWPLVRVLGQVLHMRDNTRSSSRVWLPALLVGLAVATCMAVGSLALFQTARGVGPMHFVSAVSIGLNAALGFAVVRLARIGPGRSRD